MLETFCFGIRRAIHSQAGPCAVQGRCVLSVACTFQASSAPSVPFGHQHSHSEGAQSVLCITKTTQFLHSEDMKMDKGKLDTQNLLRGESQAVPPLP